MIGTGYFDKGQWTRDFAKLWMENLLRYTPKTKEVYVVCAGCEYPIKSDHIITIPGINLGHVGEYVDGKRNGRFCGWSSSIMTLCSIAYGLGEDLIFLEQDCLAFGPWIERAYKDMEKAQFVFGAPHKTSPYMPCSQALFVIRHSFLTTFMEKYLTLPPDMFMLPEEKFLRIMEAHPSLCAHLSFGCDRERPIPYGDEVVYAQQLIPMEIDEFKKRGRC